MTKEILQARSQLMRVHEANCKIEFPTSDEVNFRIAIMKQLGRDFALKEVRTAAITGPVLTTAMRPGPGAKAEPRRLRGVAASD